MRENRSLGFPTMSDTNRPVMSQKKARILKFWVKVEKESYYPCSKNKGAVTAQLICAFVFAKAIIPFSHGAAQMSKKTAHLE